MFDLSATITPYGTQDLVAILVLGVIGGVFGGLYNYLLDRILRTYSIINEYELSSSHIIMLHPQLMSCHGHRLQVFKLN